MRGGRRREGVGLLGGWSVLYAWMVIITPPGNACDYSPKNPQPLFPRGQWTTETRFRHQHADTPASASLADIRPTTPPAAHVPGTALPLPLANGHPSLANGHAPLTNEPRPNAPPPPRRKSSTRSRRDDGDAPPAPPWGRFPPRRPRSFPRTAGARAARSSSPIARTTAASVARCVLSAFPSLPLIWRSHVPQCILKFDHHCPWIGQCVGARNNHKFFLNFALATALFTLYTFASLLAFNVPGALRGGPGADPQEGVVIGIAALFALFTLSLDVAHTRMVLLSQTTVDSLGVQRMKEREGVGCAEFGTKRAACAACDAEWGAPDTEGNLRGILRLVMVVGRWFSGGCSPLWGASRHERKQNGNKSKLLAEQYLGLRTEHHDGPRPYTPSAQHKAPAPRLCVTLILC
ncbi:DHHC palmitoyltransferase-domain-containing protein [Mycena rosella]|uniref:Palmitoyltransferase n=1 Tax=Mycena rosella TaxID=1033263 RepID=A0AAD7GS15_MYCRO|nr:DHHC palmitoyltransferase-domain-containing protein [Mycena rosella]